MKASSTALLVLLAVASLGLWGCTQQNNGATASKVKELEARYVKLEEDYRVVIAASEGHRRRIAQLERERGELTQQITDLKVIAQERDTLLTERDQVRDQLKTRTSERDNLHAQISQFGKDLQGLLGRVEAAAATLPGANVTVAVPTSHSTE